VTVAAKIRVDQRDLQGNVLAGYNYPHALFVGLRVSDPERGREWLGEVVAGGGVTTAVPFGESPPEATLNIAFTHDGLRALGVSDRVLLSFPDDYRQGMAARAAMLGDDGPDAPPRWETGLRPGEPHVLVTLAAQGPEVLAERRTEIEERAAGERSGVQIVHTQPAAVIADPTTGAVAREHFGFADGLAQPSIAGAAADDPSRQLGPWRRNGQGTPGRRRGMWKPLAPGEFVLGYPDEAGVVAESPVDPLRRNGSYMVVRKLRQNVALFNRFLLNAAGGDERAAERLAAKIVGRWRDGTPLVNSPEPPEGPGADEPDNDFRFGDDPYGLRCPLGAHIRRANPRDSLGFGGRLTARHRIIRRGMPYGPAPVNPLVEDGLERGLMFVCYQASIARQFEVVQGRWLADGDAFGLGEDRDFVLGGEDPNGKMVLQGNPPQVLSPRRSFVVNRGGGYFFAPGVAALRALAAGV
jgi:Dyp-type peroxidase family